MRASVRNAIMTVSLASAVLPSLTGCAKDPVAEQNRHKCNEDQPILDLFSRAGIPLSEGRSGRVEATLSFPDEGRIKWSLERVSQRDSTDMFEFRHTRLIELGKQNELICKFDVHGNMTNAALVTSVVDVVSNDNSDHGDSVQIDLTPDFEQSVEDRLERLVHLTPSGTLSPTFFGRP